MLPNHICCTSDCPILHSTKLYGNRREKWLFNNTWGENANIRKSTTNCAQAVAFKYRRVKSRDTTGPFGHVPTIFIIIFWHVSMHVTRRALLRMLHVPMHPIFLVILDHHRWGFKRIYTVYIIAWTLTSALNKNIAKGIEILVFLKTSAG